MAGGFRNIRTVRGIKRHRENDDQLGDGQNKAPGEERHVISYAVKDWESQGPKEGEHSPEMNYRAEIYEPEEREVWRYRNLTASLVL